MNEEIKQFLENHPEFRERKNKNKWLGGIIFKKYRIGIDLVTNKMDDRVRDILGDIVADISNADRAWRKILEENENLRGTDYGSKDELEINKQRELGYNV